MSSRSSLDQNDGRNQESSAGARSLAEILSQPGCWSSCLAGLDETGKLRAVRDRFADASEWLFIGCGSSYYVALSAAANLTALTGLPARAVPASELLLYPDLVLGTRTSCVPVLISRSGRTSEVLKAAELLKSRNIPALAISCTKDQPLEKLAEMTIVLPWASEQSTVMTRSFSSMLLTLQALAATLAGDSGFFDCLRKMPDAAAASFRSLPPKILEFASAHRFADYVCLGQGPFYGLACESALKVTEMSVSYAQSFHTLEFRHGPKSILSPETLLIFLLSESAAEAECKVLEEVKSLGGATLVIANKASARVRAAADLLVELSLAVPELARLAAYLFPVQFLGLYTGLSKGLDPDSPRNLSRVVILDKKDSSQEPEHAAF